MKAKNHKCESSGKSFSQAGHLKTHMYEGHKQYKCEICGKSFSENQYMKKHTKTIHHGFK